MIADDIDYISPGLAFQPRTDLFPNRQVGDKHANDWPYLRREVDHLWYVDARQPDDGFINIDETSVLVGVARSIRGAGLEVGSLRGWSTLHLAMVLESLDAIDPVFGKADVRNEIDAALAEAGVADKCRLHAGASPAMIHELGGRGQRWSMAFIDGNHDAAGPSDDARAVIPYMTRDAAVVFHDLASPYVAAGLALMRAEGWTCRIYQTMQIMGVATRGAARAPRHSPDPGVEWRLPDHLQSFTLADR